MSMTATFHQQFTDAKGKTKGAERGMKASNSTMTATLHQPFKSAKGITEGIDHRWMRGQAPVPFVPTNYSVIIPNFDPHQSASALLAFLKRLVLKHRWLPPMPSATYFLSTATKSKQKMPLSCAEGLAQRKSLL